MSQITTHILDTTKGKPAQGVNIILYRQQHSDWQKVAEGTTDPDGRISNLLDENTILEPGIYKLKFDVQPYFDASFTASFYPFVEIIFTINSAEHYHVPLLLNPFGYATYRGS